MLSNYIQTDDFYFISHHFFQLNIFFFRNLNLFGKTFEHLLTPQNFTVGFGFNLSMRDCSFLI